MKRNWKKINARLIQHGTMLVDLRFIQNQKMELENMNQGKVGKPFQYCDGLITFAGIWHCYARLGYRQTKGLLKGIQQKEPLLNVPCYSTLNRRFNKLPTHVHTRKNNEPFLVAVDASGISITNRGEWMRKIHRKGKIDECKGFLKIHVAVNVKTKEIVAIEITRENVGDNTMLKQLLIQTVENTGRSIDHLFADGGYDTYENFEMCQDLGINPAIRIDDNAITTPPPDTFRERRRGEPVRRKHARIQLANRDQWKKSTGYGLRWMVESVFSVLKRRHGEYAMAHNYKNMQQEFCFKAKLYNQLL